MTMMSRNMEPTASEEGALVLMLHPGNCDLDCHGAFIEALKGDRAHIVCLSQEGGGRGELIARLGACGATPICASFLTYEDGALSDPEEHGSIAHVLSYIMQAHNLTRIFVPKHNGDHACHSAIEAIAQNLSRMTDAPVIHEDDLPSQSEIVPGGGDPSGSGTLLSAYA
ncbi:hypothetical protein [Thioclava sp. F36-7]|uniref:hypothetical protein n=1 Tax=Thioclava sp. F36-7 TaxID=1915317 RepID=UPI001180A868|nr:hypothetical protein [Thioclava sp. F36-7]